MDSFGFSLIVSLSVMAALAAIVPGFRLVISRLSANVVTFGATIVLVFCLVTFISGSVYWAMAVSAVMTAINIWVSRSRLSRNRLLTLDALARFCQGIADGVGGGADLSEALRSAASCQKGVLEPELRRVQVEISTTGVESAMHNFATTVDLSTAHLLAAHLIQANKFPSGRLGAALASIVADIDAFVAVEQEMAIARRRQEFEVRGIVVVFISFVIFTNLLLPDLSGPFLANLSLLQVFPLVIAAVVGLALSARLSRTVSGQDFRLRRTN